MLAAVVAPTVMGWIGDALSKGDRNAANQAVQDGMAELQKLGVPPDYAKNIVYEQIKNLGDYHPEFEKDLGELKSQLGALTERTEGRQTQMKALEGFRGLSEQGLSNIDRLALAEAQNASNLQNKANQEGIIQDLQTRGMAGGGGEMAARMAAQQSSANQLANQGMNVAAQSEQSRRDALARMGSLGGEIRGADTQFDTATANARDIAARYSMDNSVNRQMRNVASTNQGNLFNIQKNQGIENSNVGIRNQQVQDRTQADQNRYNQMLAKAGAHINASQGVANQYNQNANRTANQWGQAGQAIGQGAAVYGQYKNNQDWMESNKPLQDAQINYYNSRSNKPN
jgi:hypothetical protein